MDDVKPSQLSVLIVDDEPHNADAIKRAFRKSPDIQVQAAASSLEALEVAKAKSFDLFLVDYSMAGLNGLEFVEQAKRVAPEAIFIMLTAYPELRQVVEAHSRGAVDGILGKPWSVEQLALTLQQTRSTLHLRAMRASRAKNAPKRDA